MNVTHTPDHVDPAEEPGWALKRLLGLHALMRRDLAILREAVVAVAHDPAGAVAAIEKLSIKQPGWSLRQFCGNFCQFVIDHHTVEDTVVFTSVLELAGDRPGIPEIVERLEAEHRILSDHVAGVERTIEALPGDSTAREAAVKAIDRLSERLYAHLDFEEKSLTSALNEVSRKMSPEDVDAPEPPAGIP